MTGQEDNVMHFPDDTPVEVRYPTTPEQEAGDRAGWPWLPGTVLEKVGPDEYRVCVEVRELAVRADGSRPTKKTPPHKLYYPCCFRDSSEIRPRGDAVN
jgi:hypothetical protein